MRRSRLLLTGMLATCIGFGRGVSLIAATDLATELTVLREDWQRQCDAARADRTIRPPDAAACVSRIVAAVDQDVTADAAFDGLCFAAGIAPPGSFDAVFDRLLDYHLARREITAVLEQHFSPPLDAPIDFVTQLLKRSPYHEVRGRALLALAMFTAERDGRAAARALLDEIDEQYGDVPYGDATLADETRGLRFEWDHLVLGATAPDIDGEDLDGIAFRLSDYRGKVVLLDFWGHW